MNESRTEGQAAGKATSLRCAWELTTREQRRSPVWGTGKDWGFHTGTSSIQVQEVSLTTKQSPPNARSRAPFGCERGQEPVRDGDRKTSAQVPSR